MKSFAISSVVALSIVSCLPTSGTGPIDVAPASGTDSDFDASTAPAQATTMPDAGSSDGDQTIDAGAPVVVDAAIEAADPNALPPSIGVVTIDATEDDYVGEGDTKIAPDGILDATFDVTLTGPLSALILVTTDASGTPNYFQQWDTIIGSSPMPPALGEDFMQGKDTWVLGVVENGQVLNAKDGSFTLDAASHIVKVYASWSGYFVPGVNFRIIGVLADGSLTKSPIFTY